MESKTIYNNEEGKTLEQIAEMFNVSVKQLQDLNPILDTNVLIAVHDIPDVEVEDTTSDILTAIQDLPKDKQTAIMDIIKALK